MDLTPQDLIEAALAEPADSHERWSHIYSLHRRGDEATFRAAAELLDSPTPGRRVLAADILAQLGADAWVPPEARPFRRPAGELLVARIEREDDPAVLQAIAHAVGHLKEERAVPALHAFRRHPDPAMRYAVVSGLLGLDDDLAVSALIELSEDPEPDVREWATFGLAAELERDDDAIRGALLARIGDSDANTRAEALRGLATRGDPRAIAPLLAELSGPMTVDDPCLLYEVLLTLAARTADERLCRVVEDAGRPWHREQHLGAALTAALERCRSHPPAG